MSAQGRDARLASMLRESLKIVAERILWARVDVQRRLRMPGPIPPLVSATAVLATTDEWRQVARAARGARLPLHPTREKNWDTLGAVRAILEHIDTGGTVLDAGSARYSCVLPWLRLYGFERLIGINLEFRRTVRHGPVEFRHGDVTATGFPDASLDAVTCLSVIEHGVSVEGFLSEAARVLRPGGLLCISTDYDREPPDTTGHFAYGQPVRVFGPNAIRTLVRQAEERGLHLIGPLQLDHEERPVHWKRMGLRYTFILLTFQRRDGSTDAAIPAGQRPL